MESAKIIGKGLKLYSNTTLNFICTGMILEVSLNIDNKLKKYLYKGNVYKGDHMYIYKLKKEILSKNINNSNIQFVHDTLLKQCMVNIRKAKIQVLNDEIKMLKKK
jgi:hypothetical protein